MGGKIIKKSQRSAKSRLNGQIKKNNNNEINTNKIILVSQQLVFNNKFFDYLKNNFDKKKKQFKELSF